MRNFLLPLLLGAILPVCLRAQAPAERTSEPTETAAPGAPPSVVLPAAKNALSTRVFAVDYLGAGNDEWLPTYGIEAAYHRHLNGWAGLSVPVKIGQGNIAGFREKRNVVSVDALLRLRYERPWSMVVPYAFAGVGFVHESMGGAETLTDANFAQLPFGAGLNFRVSRYSFLTVQGEYRTAPALEGHDNAQIGAGYHFNLAALQRNPAAETTDEKHADTDQDGTPDATDRCPTLTGPAATFGCPDSDRDGLTDDVDRCPETAGTVGFQGCADTDQDGIADPDDHCPEQRGPRDRNGCPLPTEPDADEDGVPDSKDRCPVKPGVAALDGCPDTDGDGISDRDDRCPSRPGTASNKGCPELDTDGDGVRDSADICPTLPGLVRLNGCPEVKEEVRREITAAARNVQFETGRATLKTESFRVLESVVRLLEEHPDYKLDIEGHTDDRGSATTNLTLSEERARACYDYLTVRGIDPARLTATGYGERRPVAPNTTEAGRSENRRVAFKLHY